MKILIFERNRSKDNEELMNLTVDNNNRNDDDQYWTIFVVVVSFVIMMMMINIHEKNIPFIQSINRSNIQFVQGFNLFFSACCYWHKQWNFLIKNRCFFEHKNKTKPEHQKNQNTETNKTKKNWLSMNKKKKKLITFWWTILGKNWIFFFLWFVLIRQRRD